MWARIAAAFQRLLSPAPESGGPRRDPAGTGDGRAGRKRGRSSAQEKDEDDDPQWKRFKMGELMHTVRNTAEGVRLTTSGVLNWVRSQSASLSSGGSPPSPVPSRLPLRRRRASPSPPPPRSPPPSPPRLLPHTRSSAGDQKDPSELLEDSSTTCPQGGPGWTPLPRPALHSTRLPRAERLMAAGDSPIAEKRPLHSPRGLWRANGHTRDSTTQRTRTASTLQTPLWKTPRSPTPGPSPAAAPRQKQADPFRPIYAKTFGCEGVPEGPRGSLAAPPSRHVGGPQTPHRTPGRKPLSTVEETILREEKEMYKQLLEAVTASYSSRPSLTRIYSPLSHRDLSGLSDSYRRLSPRAASEASSALGSETPPHLAFWADTPSSVPASSPSLPDASPGTAEGRLLEAADATSTGSDSESVIVVKVKEAPKRDPSRMPSFDAVHWINELMSMYDSRARERRRLIEEQEALAQRLKQERLRDKEALPKLVTAQLSLGVPLIEEIPIADIPQEEAEEETPRVQVGREVEDNFIELTEEMEEEVSRVFQPGNPDEVLTEAFRLTITRKDIHTLSHLNWLNDEVINFYMNLLVARSGKGVLPSVHAFNTFFFPKVRSDGYQAVRRWTKKVDIFAVDILLVPVHLGVHWCLAVVDFRKKAVSYYDSMGGSNDEACRILLRYLKQESLDKKSEEFDASGWVLGSKSSREIPQQMNGSDCGMFTCKYADYISRDQPIRFTQTHMPYFRRRMAWEILHQKLL